MTTQGRAGAGPREWIIWFGALVLVTGAMAGLRTRLNSAHVALAYLLVVQGASARGGRPVGLALSAIAFLCFDLLFLPPFGTLVIQDPLNWLVLVAFLATAILSAQLLYRAQAEANAARARASEIDRLAALGAETLNVARAEEALTAIVAVIRASLAMPDCLVRTADDPTTAADLLSVRATRDGVSVAEACDGQIRAGVLPGELSAGTLRVFIRPLRVRDRTVGVLRLSRHEGIALTPEQIRILEALAYYAALGVERVRLVAEAGRVAALQESHRAKDAVIASVSHDLRTPLTTIKGLAHEIARSGDDRAHVIEEEADRLNAFVAQMLDLSRISIGTAAPDIQPNEAEDLLGAAAQQVAGRMHDRELRITVNGGDPLLFGRFDFSQTLRALVNLIENAAKYSPPHTTIDLSVRRENGALLFSVGDRGAGVPAAERESIFEPFYRQGGVADSGGVGLGLAIARGIARAQDGDVTYDERPGGGSEFTLSVPAIAPEDILLDET
jgi:two-component system sensor histidine kinase KdpD